MSDGTDITRFDRLVSDALDAAFGPESINLGSWSWDGDYANGAADDDATITERPWAVVQTNNEGDYWIAAEQTRDNAIATCRALIYQSDRYAWWPLAIIDIERGAILLVEAEVSITLAEVTP